MACHQTAGSSACIWVNQYLETYHFEKGARIYFKSRDNGQEIHIEPEKALTKRTATA